MKLKIGDKIQVVSAEDFHNCPIGTMGVIVGIGRQGFAKGQAYYTNCYACKMDYDLGHNFGDSLKSVGQGQYLRESDVKLVKKGVEKVCSVSLAELLKEAFPHGHPDYVPDTIEELQLHSDKNHDYSKGGDPLGNFDRVSKIMSMYPGFPYTTKHGVAIVYAMKQIDAVLWSLSQGIVHKVEGIAGRLRDISVYMKLALIMLKKGTK